MIVRQRLSPIPVPFPASFVVKKGSIIFSWMFKGIPGPESLKEMYKVASLT